MRSTCTYTLVPQDRVRVEWRGDGHLSLWTEDARLCVRIEGAERAREIGRAILAALPGGAPSEREAGLLEALRALKEDEWRVTVDWGARDEREAILAQVDAALAAYEAKE